MDIVRTSLGKILHDARLDRVAPVRVVRDLALRLNRTLGEPVCTTEELAKRRAAEARLESLKKSGKTAPKAKVQAPVTIYFEKDRNARELSRMEELFGAKGITYEKLDVAGDDATLAFIAREAKVKGDDLPVVFVAGNVVGTYPSLVAFDVSGKLEKALFGA